VYSCAFVQDVIKSSRAVFVSDDLRLFARRAGALPILFCAVSASSFSRHSNSRRRLRSRRLFVLRLCLPAPLAAFACLGTLSTTNGGFQILLNLLELRNELSAFRSRSQFPIDDVLRSLRVHEDHRPKVMFFIERVSTLFSFNSFSRLNLFNFSIFFGGVFLSPSKSIAWPSRVSAAGR